METQFNAKLSHVLCTHNFHMTKNVHKFIEHNDSIKILAGGNGDNRSFHNEEAKNKNIIEIGNISV